jgi:hypothetical protein
MRARPAAGGQRVCEAAELDEHGLDEFCQRGVGSMGGSSVLDNGDEL